MTMQPRVKLSAIVDALDMQSDETHAFLDKQTGEVVVLSDEELRAAEDGDDLDDYPEWQRENVERAKAVQADEGGDGGRFLPLPDRFEINEWDMMRDFAAGLENEDHAEALLNAIHGRGAFRYFKDRVHELGLADAWYTFRDGQYRQAALDWCEVHGIEADADA
jgi:hypothetical protein